MKRHYIYSFVCILMFSLLFSCDDFLNENPKDKVIVIVKGCRAPAGEFTI